MILSRRIQIIIVNNSNIVIIMKESKKETEENQKLLQFYLIQPEVYQFQVLVNLILIRSHVIIQLVVIVTILVVMKEVF